MDHVCGRFLRAGNRYSAQKFIFPFYSPPLLLLHWLKLSREVDDANDAFKTASRLIGSSIKCLHTCGRKKPCSSTSLCAKISPWIHLLCCLLQALTLVVLRSEFCNQSLKQSVESLLERATIEWDACKLESGSLMAMASVVCWLLAFALALVHTIGRRSLPATTIAKMMNAIQMSNRIKIQSRL